MNPTLQTIALRSLDYLADTLVDAAHNGDDSTGVLALATTEWYLSSLGITRQMLDDDRQCGLLAACVDAFTPVPFLAD
jgi:hypothetical protein